jgi:hypothetical protein
LCVIPSHTPNAFAHPRSLHLFIFHSTAAKRGVKLSKKASKRQIALQGGTTVGDTQTIASTTAITVETTKQQAKVTEQV